ncbi:MAG: hypothetical protein LBQ03_01315 [Puniceicoccales bacterium]|jgi:hypothetical protein|nr:hypothetical protein [Puniceicoccales bacterium]
MLSGLLSVFNGKLSPHFITETAKAISSSATIRVNTSRLPKAFREKFRLGDHGIKQDRGDNAVSNNTPYEISPMQANGGQVSPSGIIDESEGDIKIVCFNLELQDQMTLIDAIQNNEKEKNGNNVEKFLINLTKKHATGKLSEGKDHAFVMYLEVGDGVYWHSELFERLIIARNGKIEKNLAYGDKTVEDNRRKWNQDSDLWGRLNAGIQRVSKALRNVKKTIRDYIMLDDSNIQNELKTNREFCDAFYEGKAKIIVYHRAVQSLTLLCFEQHDERVAAIDRKRNFFMKSKSAMGFVICALIFHIINHIIHPIPFLGSYLSVICNFVATVAAGMALYKGYQLLPMQWRMGIGNFVNTKIVSRLLP